jgi:SNF2 family DNA or RNA helicase
MEFTYKTTPFEHQRTALKAGAQSNNFAYFMEMGTGKTKVTIDNASYLFCEKKINYAIVIAPNSVYLNWEKEINTHCSVPVKIFKHKFDEFIDPILTDPLVLNWYLINVEAMSHSSGIKILSKLLGKTGETTLLIIDECTTIKNRSAKRTKNLVKLGRYAKYKRILTGSPVTKSPLDLYSQCDFLDNGLLGHDSFYTFRARYAVMHEIDMGGRSVLLPKYYTNLDELEKILKKFSYRCRKSECLDLPEKLYSQRYIDLKGEHQQTYERLKKNAWSVIQDEEVSYSNKLTEILKLHQCVNGHVKTDEGNIMELPDPKLEELMTIVDEHEGKFIIWANYVYNIEKIIKSLEDKYGKKSVVSIYGAVDTKTRSENVKRFETEDEVRFFVGNPSTGGYGLNLVSASYVLYYSNSYNLEVREQSEDRAHRIGQSKNLLVIDLICRNTVDEMIISALHNKIKLSAQTLGEQAKKWLK